MNNNCLPCVVHDRKPLRELVLPIIVDTDHAHALLEMKGDAEYNLKIDKLTDDFYESINKLGDVSYGSLVERSDAAQFARDLKEGVYEFFIDMNTIYYRKLA